MWNWHEHSTIAIEQQVCDFVIRGLSGNWKYVSSYTVSVRRIKYIDSKSKLEESIGLLQALGLKVKVVCDQGSNNREVFNRWGIDSNKFSFKVYDEEICAIICLSRIIFQQQKAQLHGEII